MSEYLLEVEEDFKKFTLRNEDDVKIHFYASIINPIMKIVNPAMIGQYSSESNLIAGGRADATFQNISFEFKKPKYFQTEKGINEALYGRDNKDHGLYDYLISSSGVKEEDDGETILKKLTSVIGVGFDGESFIFARFVKTSKKERINTEKVSIKIADEQPVSFCFENQEFKAGLKKMALLLKQQNKIALTKKNVLSVINTKNLFVRGSIFKTYKELCYNLNNPDGSDRVRTLYHEWDRVFGILYGNDSDATDFTEVTSKIKDAYGISQSTAIDSKIYLFAMQTFFNIFLKLLVYSFLSQIIDPTFTTKQHLTKSDIDKLFDGTKDDTESVVGNFFEAHFLEWFTYTCSGFEENIVNETLIIIDNFDLGTYVLKPEDIQDILQEVYMGLIPKEMRHLMGEYFSPDWVVEHVLDMVGYKGDIDKKLIDPCAGSGSFLTQAIKRVIKRNHGKINRADLEKITNNIVGFDINPISVVSAKANYILTAFSALFDNYEELNNNKPISIPVFIADSILSPIIYSEENDKTLKLSTTVGTFELPKFKSYAHGSAFLIRLSEAIHEKSDYEVFRDYILARQLIDRDDEPVVKALFERLYVLHRSGKDSFWPIILRNSFAPVMIGDKFDYVVGNPPWIAWKSMSKSYREGTLAIWKSYGIFEKNAYDKKTTHDDFGMAVTYVAIDQYLKNNASMVFLLPASFLKSTKGGEGFRKFEIIRNGQDIPFRVDCVHDFSGVNLFTVPTVAIKFTKNCKMEYPMDEYCNFIQKGNRRKIDSHANWTEVKQTFEINICSAQPVDQNDRQSAWLTLRDMTFANAVLDKSKKRIYKGRKGIEPAGAKGVYILKKPVRTNDGYLKIKNDISRQRREDIKEKGAHIGIIEEDYVYPMLGGRNISRWVVKDCEYMLVPHTAKYRYGVPEKELLNKAPETYMWLNYYHDELLKTRIQNGKFFNEKSNPFYRLDNVGEYTYAPYKVLWKEQTGSMSAVVVSSYLESVPDADKGLFSHDKTVVVDSKVLMLGLDKADEAYYVCGIINSPKIVKIIDGYAIPTNRGVDILKYIAIPKYDRNNSTHKTISNLSKKIHLLAKSKKSLAEVEKKLDSEIYKLFSA